MLVVLVELVAAIVSIAELIGMLLAVFAIITLIFDPKGKQKVANLVANFVGGALSIAVPLLGDLEAELAPVARAFVNSLETNGAGLLNIFKDPAAAIALNSWFDTELALLKLKATTPDQSPAIAAAAISQAAGNGIASAGVAALFESVFPEKLNVLMAAAPILAKMAGFDEVIELARTPLYDAAFGKGLEYYYRSVFKPELPDEADAVQWHSRRLLSDAQLSTLFNYSGLKAEYEPAFIASAYRAVQPRAVMALLQDVDFPTAEMTSLLQFAGLRDADINLMLPLMKLNSTKTVRQQYLAALMRSVELGTDTPAALSRAMTDMQYSADAQNWVQLTVAEKKLEQLAELYRKSVSESYRYGTLSDAGYVPALEAIGIANADAQAHYAIDSIAKHGKLLVAALRAEERLLQQQKSAAMKAAIAEYRAGTIDALALEAALLAAGIEPTIASFAVVIQTARTEGTLTMVYGVELGHTAALLLKEKVAAYKEQAVKKIGDPAIWTAELAALGIPDVNVKALVSEWEAQANKIALPV
jgi:hypothetical protein